MIRRRVRLSCEKIFLPSPLSQNVLRNRSRISVVSFDLDGTLVTREYVDYFWLDLVPRLYAEKYGVELEEAKRKVFASYEEIGSRDTRWYMPSYWFRRFGIEEHLEMALREAAERIKPYEDALETVEKLSGKYTLVISTSAARDFVNLVLERVPFYRYSFKSIFSSSSDFGLAGKPPAFFRKILELLNIDSSEMLHIGDDEENDLKNALEAGINAVLVERNKGHDLRVLLDGII